MAVAGYNPDDPGGGTTPGGNGSPGTPVRQEFSQLGPQYTVPTWTPVNLPSTTGSFDETGGLKPTDPNGPITTLPKTSAAGAAAATTTGAGGGAPGLPDLSSMFTDANQKEWLDYLKSINYMPAQMDLAKRGQALQEQMAQAAATGKWGDVATLQAQLQANQTALANQQANYGEAANWSGITGWSGGANGDPTLAAYQMMMNGQLANKQLDIQAANSPAVAWFTARGQAPPTPVGNFSDPYTTWKFNQGGPPVDQLPVNPAVPTIPTSGNQGFQPTQVPKDMGAVYQKSLDLYNTWRSQNPTAPYTRDVYRGIMQQQGFPAAVADQMFDQAGAAGKKGAVDQYTWGGWLQNDINQYNQQQPQGNNPPMPGVQPQPNGTLSVPPSGVTPPKPGGYGISGVETPQIVSPDLANQQGAWTPAQQSQYGVMPPDRPGYMQAQVMPGSGSQVPAQQEFLSGVAAQSQMRPGGGSQTTDYLRPPGSSYYNPATGQQVTIDAQGWEPGQQGQAPGPRSNYQQDAMISSNSNGYTDKTTGLRYQMTNNGLVPEKAYSPDELARQAARRQAGALDETGYNEWAQKNGEMDSRGRLPGQPGYGITIHQGGDTQGNLPQSPPTSSGQGLYDQSMQGYNQWRQQNPGAAWDQNAYTKIMGNLGVGAPTAQSLWQQAQQNGAPQNAAQFQQMYQQAQMAGGPNGPNPIPGMTYAPGADENRAMGSASPGGGGTYIAGPPAASNAPAAPPIPTGPAYSTGAPPWAQSMASGYKMPSFVGQGSADVIPSAQVWSRMSPQEQQAVMEMAKSVEGMDQNTFMQQLAARSPQWGQMHPAAYRGY